MMFHNHTLALDKPAREETNDTIRASKGDMRVEDDLTYSRHHIGRQITLARTMAHKRESKESMEFHQSV